MLNNRFSTCSPTWMPFGAALALAIALCLPALAQVPAHGNPAHLSSQGAVKAAGSLPWLLLFHDAVFLSWLFGSMVVAWLFSVVLSMVMIQAFYPPNAARFACWLAFSLWGLFITFVLFGHLFPYFLPSWFVTSLLLILFVAGVIALITRRRPV